MNSMQTYQFCYNCKTQRPEEDFVKRRGKVTTKCVYCNRKLSAQWRKNNPTRYKEQMLQWNFPGMTYEMWSDMLAFQASGCAICGCNMCDTKKGPCVDHNHKTGKIRGLLCMRCNSAIGLLDEDLSVISSALTYLLKHCEEEND